MNFISPDEFFQLPPDKQRDYLHRVQNIKYGLYWNERRHAEAVVTKCETLMPVLDEAEDKRIFYTPPAADLFDTPERPQPTHLLIEGDNYHALSVLNYTHRGKVDLIYIDPPYNTGNRDFRYNDNFVDKEDGDRHTKWLSFMHRRLQLAKDLLKESGVIFISIDDNEVAQLKLLCDKVFGEGNFVANVIWQKRTSPDARKNLAPAHDYILVYSKLLFSLKLNLLPLSETRIDDYKNPDNDARGVWASVDLTGQTGHATPSQYFTITTPSGKKIQPPEGRCWAIAESTFLKLQEEGKIWFGKNGESKPRLKKFLSESEGTTVWTWWPYQEVGSTQEATKILNETLGFPDGLATTPKPTRLIERLLRLTTQNECPTVILDFFAGSGTTGHAVLELNKEDGGRRQFILGTNNEVTD